MATILLGASRMNGTSAKTGNPYDIIEIIVAEEVPVSDMIRNTRSGQSTKTGRQVSAYRGDPDLFARVQAAVAEGQTPEVVLEVVWSQSADGKARSDLRGISLVTAAAKKASSKVESLG